MAPTGRAPTPTSGGTTPGHLPVDAPGPRARSAGGTTPGHLPVDAPGPRARSASTGFAGLPWRTLRPRVLLIGVAFGSMAIFGLIWPDVARGLQTQGLSRPDRVAHLVGCGLLIVAAWFLTTAARRTGGRRGLGLAVVALASVVLSVSTAAMTMSTLPTTGLISADGPTAGQFAAFAVLIVGMSLLPSNRRWSAIPCIEVGLVALAVLSLSWLAPVRDSSGPNAGLVDVVGRFPPSVLLTTTMVLGAVYLVRAAPAMRPGDGALVVAFLLLPSTIYTSIVGQFAGLGAAALRSSSLWWMVAPPVLVLAGWQCSHDCSTVDAGRRDRDHRPEGDVTAVVDAERPVEWVPAAATLLTLSALATQRMFIDSLDPALLAMGIVVVGLSTARAAFLQRDQAHLQHQLADLRHGLHVRARTDELTGLGNRLGLEEAMTEAMSNADGTLHVFYADIDDFKTVNDALGHETGDLLLVEVARRLVSTLGPNVYRLGGDEFVALEIGITPDEAASIADELIDESTMPVRVDRVSVPARLSIGLARSDDGRDDPTADGLLRKADLALNRAKELGRGRWSNYDAWLQDRSDRRLSLQSGLSDTVTADRFEVRYRPQVDMTTGSLVGVEAMLRWRSPDDHLLTPSEYFAAAADGGLVPAISRLTIGISLDDWRDEAPPDLPLALNLHRQELAYGGLAAHLEEMLGSGRRDVRLLISESALMDDACQATVDQLQEAGHLLCVREFGTASSSLRRLGHLRSPCIRFDRSFVTGLDHRPVDRLVLETVIALAREMEVDVSADGVTRQWQVDALVDLGITNAQGWLFGQPRAWTEFASRHIHRETPSSLDWNPRHAVRDDRRAIGLTS